MTDDVDMLKKLMKNRRSFYFPQFSQTYVNTKPEIKITESGERILNVLGIEVMSDYQRPYMKKLAEVVTRNGGDILEVGYGLGILSEEIEKYRISRKLGKHYVIEINKHLADEARKSLNLDVHEGDWKSVIKTFGKKKFDGIVYDGLALKQEDMHCDGVVFIKGIAKKRLLKENGTLTFFVDAADSLGSRFLGLLQELGFKCTELYKIEIHIPERKRQIWSDNHFLAPVVHYFK